LDLGRRTALGVLAGDEATSDDVAQEVAIQAVRHVSRLRDPAALDAWLHRVAVRKAIDAVRGSNRRRDSEANHTLEFARSAGDPSPIDDDRFGQWMRGLPPRQRAALTLRYAHDLDDDAIAAALGCRTGTVRALLSRGRTAMRARLASDPTFVPALPSGDDTDV
jgi:RNA polymerase sigma-70 factor (ECF subfamily)